VTDAPAVEPPRVDVLGVGISATTLQESVRLIEQWVERGDRRYVNVCTVHTVMECRQAPTLLALVNASGLSTPDGMPLVWLSRLRGHRRTDRVYGPDLMLALCARGERTGHRHFFYGGRPGVAERLVERLTEQYPGLQVAGVYAPPHRPVDVDEEPAVLEGIEKTRPDIVWVGLGTPKQDYWIARHRRHLSAAALIAVGAAFDMHAGLIRQAPRWIQRSGLEWAFRLAQEPRRLAYRYLVLNPRFVLAVLGDWRSRP